MSYKSSLAVICLFCFLPLTACSFRTGVPVGTIPQIEAPSQSKVTSTRSLVERHLKEEGHSMRQSGKDYRRTLNILNKITKAAGLKPGDFPLYISDAGEKVNAMAVNDNTMVVYLELISRLPKDEELAAIIGHEVAHMIAKHGADRGAEERSQYAQIGTSLLSAGAFVGASLAGVDAESAGLIGDATAATTGVLSTGAFVLAYDREVEYEADHIGMMLMAKAGYNPKGAISFWSKAEEVLGGGSSFSFLSTHPSGDGRIEALKEALPIAERYYHQSKKSSSGKSGLKQVKGPDSLR